MQENNAIQKHVCSHVSCLASSPPENIVIQKWQTSLRVRWLRNPWNFFQNIITLFAMWLTVQLAWAQTAFKLQALCVGVNQ